jgi:hypothetical protein
MTCHQRAHKPNIARNRDFLVSGHHLPSTPPKAKNLHDKQLTREKNDEAQSTSSHLEAPPNPHSRNTLIIPQRCPSCYFRNFNIRGTTTDDSPRTRASGNYLKWLDTGEEDQQTRNLLSQIRKNILRMSDDISLTLKTIRKMQRMHRWRGRASPRDEFGLAFLRARSKLKRVKTR